MTMIDSSKVYLVDLMQVINSAVNDNVMRDYIDDELPEGLITFF